MASQPFYDPNLDSLPPAIGTVPTSVMPGGYYGPANPVYTPSPSPSQSGSMSTGGNMTLGGTPWDFGYLPNSNWYDINPISYGTYNPGSMNTGGSMTLGTTPDWGYFPSSNQYGFQPVDYVGTGSQSTGGNMTLGGYGGTSPIGTSATDFGYLPSTQQYGWQPVDYSGTQSNVIGSPGLPSDYPQSGSDSGVIGSPGSPSDYPQTDPGQMNVGGNDISGFGGSFDITGGQSLGYVPQPGYNYYDAGGGTTYVYDSDWNYLYTQPGAQGTGITGTSGAGSGGSQPMGSSSSFPQYQSGTYIDPTTGQAYQVGSAANGGSVITPTGQYFNSGSGQNWTPGGGYVGSGGNNLSSLGGGIIGGVGGWGQSASGYGGGMSTGPNAYGGYQNSSQVGMSMHPGDNDAQGSGGGINSLSMANTFKLDAPSPSGAFLIKAAKHGG